MADIAIHFLTDDGDGKQFVIDDARTSLSRAGMLIIDENLLDDVGKLLQRGGLPHFIELHTVAKRHDVEFNADLLAFIVVLMLRDWQPDNVDALSLVTYVKFSELTGGIERIDLLRPLLNACACLAGYQLGGEADREPAAKAFRLLTLQLAGWDSGIAAACALNACSLAVEGPTLLAAAEALAQVAGQPDDDSARLSLAYRVIGLSRMLLAGAQVQLELYDAVEAACRYAPRGSTRGAVGKILQHVIEKLPFLHTHWFLWNCAFDPGSVHPRLLKAAAYAQPVWDLADEPAAEAVVGLSEIAGLLEDQRLRLMPADMAATAVADLNKWSIDHHAFRRAIPFSKSLQREADRSDILLTLSHEVIHMQSALGWLGANLAALRIAATECELLLLSVSGEVPGEDGTAGGPTLELATLRDWDLTTLALVEQQLELVRKAQLLRATWLPWLEGIAIFGELSADPVLDDEISTGFSNVIMSLNDRTPGQIADKEGISFEDGWWALRRASEKFYSEALEDSGRARLRTYLDRGPGRYLAGYLAVRAELTGLRRVQRLNGVTAYNVLLAMTTHGTRLAVPSLELSPQEFEVRAKVQMLGWLRQMSGLDASSIAVVAGARPWKWITAEGVHRVVDTERSDPEWALSLLEAAVPLVMTARAFRAGRADEFGELGPELAASVGAVLDLAAELIPAPDEEVAGALASLLDDRMSLVPIGQVSAPFWLSVGGSGPRLMIVLRVTEADRKQGTPSYDAYMIPLTEKQSAELQEQMRTLHCSRIDVTRYADISTAAPDQGRGYGQNVIGLAYGDFTLVQLVGQLTGSPPSPVLTQSVQSRLRPPPITELDTTIIMGTAIAERAISWIETAECMADSELPAEIVAWMVRVLQLARSILFDNDAQLVSAASESILAELGWRDGEFSGVCQVGLRSLYDEESPDLTRLLDAVLATGTGTRAAEVDGMPERVRTLLFESTEYGDDLRRFQGEGT
jgi:hypothetical protein